MIKVKKGIESKEHLCDLWTKMYANEGKPDWSHILPYYAENIIFRDSIQEIKGIEEFTQMTERLVERSKDMKMEIANCIQDGNIIIVEWIMSLTFRKYPNSKMYGVSRHTLDDKNMIIEQRDYFDLWGDIFDNIPFMKKRYRKFMKKRFG